MAHKTFISYKYSDVVAGRRTNLRDRIIKSLGDDAKYYMGEDGYSDDLSSYKAATIKAHLSEKIYGTSVTIVIMSPNMRQSDWMEWELSYSLKNTSRDGKTSHTNGLVGVVQKNPADSFNGYSWFRTFTNGWNMNVTFDLIRDNRGNRIPGCAKGLSGDYVDIVTEETFLRDPGRYINDAYEKSQNTPYYRIRKQ